MEELRRCRRSSRGATTGGGDGGGSSSAGSPSRSSGSRRMEAELTKIFANVWRYIQFATANQFFMIATDHGVDFYRIYDALTRDYPRMAGLPKSGFAAGPCLFKDTMQLAAANNNNFALGQAAMLINEGLPNFVVRHDSKSATPGADDGRHSRDGVQGRQRRSARVAVVQAPQDPRIRGGRGALHRRLHQRPQRSCRSRRWSSDQILLIWRSAPRISVLEVPASKPVIDIWNFYGKGTLPDVKILVTGSAGFIAGYLVEELLAAGHEVVGLDNYSKYGPVERAYDTNPRYRAVVGDAKDVGIVQRAPGRLRPVRRRRRDHRRNLACSTSWPTTCSPRTSGSQRPRSTPRSGPTAPRRLQKITVISSSMVYESTSIYPTPEGEQRRCPPPRSTYGFQKLATEYFAQGARGAVGLPYTIVRPFNCIGMRRARALCDKEVMSGNVRLAMSHVVPDLVQKILKGQDPLHILGDGRQVRHYTYGGDLARGIRLAIESPVGPNEDFNLSTAESTSVLELAEVIWRQDPGRRTPATCV